MTKKEHLVILDGDIDRIVFRNSWNDGIFADIIKEIGLFHIELGIDDIARFDIVDIVDSDDDLSLGGIDRIIIKTKRTINKTFRAKFLKMRDFDLDSTDGIFLDNGDGFTTDT